MIDHNITFDSSRQRLNAKVELYNGSTLVKICTCEDILQDFRIDRIGENSKFFGFGICQSATITIIDLYKELEATKGMEIKIAYGDGINFIYPYPTFYLDSAERDEDNYLITLHAYDKLYQAYNYDISDIDLPTVGTIQCYVDKIVSFLGLNGLEYIGIDPFWENVPFNINGDEKLREILNDAAEAEQGIYYVNNVDKLVLKRLNVSNAPDLTVESNNYYSLKAQDAIRLNALCHTTQLEDNVETISTGSGITQYIRDNVFWSTHEDLGNLLENAMFNLTGININPIITEWSGNFLLEIGDKVKFITEEGNYICYILNDKVEYTGVLTEYTEWIYEANDEETPSNPTTLGEKLNLTYAKVDKANKQITLLVSDNEQNKADISSLQLTANDISASVRNISETTEATTNGLEQQIETLTQEVNTKITAEDLTIAVSNIKDDGVSRVETVKGFTFDESGLTVHEDGNEMKTQITENGMTVYQNNASVLTANNVGVDAVNLKASTYLIIGNNSRFEDYKGNRTACFWIGG